MAHMPYFRTAAGSNTAVLLIHGILGMPDHFRDFVDLIPQNWSVRNLLLAGHGGSVSDFSAASMKQWKHQVADAAEELCSTHENIIIAAHSMGTLFALDAALSHKEVRQLFLLAVPLRIAPGFRVLYNSLRIAFDRIDPNDFRLVSARRAYSIQADPHLWRYLGWIPRYLELFQEIRRMRKAVSGLRTPCLVFQSGQDELLSRRAAEPLEGLPCTEVRILPNSGHYGYPPQDYRQMICEFQKILNRFAQQEESKGKEA